MEQINPRSRRDRFGSKIDRDHSTLLAYSVPWATILLGSLCAMLPIIAPAPVMPPFGFIFMLAWRTLRPGLLPLWAGLPLGMFDDLFSGQPFGFGILFFSLALLAFEMIEARFPWRNFLHDWMTVTMMLSIYLILGALLSGARPSAIQLEIILPQLLFSIVLFPILARVVAMLDRVRLARVRRLN